jgi:hypothetical protein
VIFHFFVGLKGNLSEVAFFLKLFS